MGSNGTPHLQGYMELNSATTLVRAREILCTGERAGVRPHLEPRRGTARQAIDYCEKDSTRVVAGIVFRQGDFCLGQGQRSDIHSAANAILGGMKRKELAINHTSTFIKYHKGLDALRFATTPARSGPPDHVFCFYGLTGTGKSRLAAQVAGENVYYKSPNNKWFDGFDPAEHTAIIIDDFDPKEAGALELPFLLRLLDRYPMR